MPQMNCRQVHWINKGPADSADVLQSPQKLYVGNESKSVLARDLDEVGENIG